MKGNIMEGGTNEKLKRIKVVKLERIAKEERSRETKRGKMEK